MKSIMIGLVVFCFAGVVSAQPWRDGERRMDAKQFGDVDRLERSVPPHQMGQKRGEFRPQKQFRPQPNFGMNGWGGDPFKPFGSGRQWGGVGGPPSPFRGAWGKEEVRRDSVHHSGRNGKHDGRGKDIKRSSEKPERQGDNKVCPFCGTTMS